MKPLTKSIIKTLIKPREASFNKGRHGFTFLVFLLGILIMTGCNNEKNQKQEILNDSTIYSSQNFSDLMLDSTVITTFFKTFPVSDTIKNEVNKFYAKRNYQFAWFNKSGITYAVPNFYNQLQNYSLDFADSSLNNTSLDSLITAVHADEKQFQLQANQVQKLELLLTIAFFKYAKKVYGGISKKVLDLEWFIPRKKKNYQILLDSLVSLTKGKNIQEPVNKYYTRLKEKLRQYRVIQRKGGLPVLVTAKKLLSIGDNDSCLLMAKQHLFLTDDLTVNDNTIVFTYSLAIAVKNFQHRMGLAENGKIDIGTINELNKPIDFRIKQMMVNMERLRWVPLEMENDYLLINIPEFKLHIFENGKPTWATNVVVGKVVTQTNILKSNLSEIILNPYWVVPESIIRNEIVPNIKKNPSYLITNNMEVLSGNKVVNPSKIKWQNYKTDVPFTIRQKPGKNNVLGKIKFMFSNNFSIYLHDTPSKNLFDESTRAFSHGCIRVAEPEKLALYLLRKDTTWNAEKVDTILKTDEEFSIRVRPIIPVYIVYFTAWVDNNGQLNFRNDLYNLDDKLSKEIFKE